MGDRPKYSSAQKAANSEAVSKRIIRLQKATDTIKQNTIYHWTLFFENGRRLELYPTTLGLHNQGRWLRHYNLDDLFSEIERFAKLPVESAGEISLIEE